MEALPTKVSFCILLRCNDSGMFVKKVICVHSVFKMLDIIKSKNHYRSLTK